MRYEVKALRGNETLTAQVLDAADAGDAAAQMVAQGYTVIAVRAKSAWPTLPWQRKRHFPLVLFSQELLALLQAGLALVEALETLTEKEQRPEVKQTLTQIIASLYEGHAFSHALQHSPANFPALYVATVRASAPAICPRRCRATSRTSRRWTRSSGRWSARRSIRCCCSWSAAW